MHETFRPDEIKRYSETYRAPEYNRTTETVSVAEYHDADSSSVCSSGTTRVQTRKSSQKKLLSAVTLSYVGAVAGAAVITTAIVVSVFLQISITNYILRANSITVAISLKHYQGTDLTATLYGDNRSYQTPLSPDEENCCVVLFDGLRSDTPYNLEITDANGKVYLSKNYRTVPSRLTAEAPVVSEIHVGIAIHLDDTSSDPVTVTLKQNGISVSPSQIYADSGSFQVKFTGLTPDTDYFIEITDIVGYILFSAPVRTLPISDPLSCQVLHRSYDTLKLRFDADRLPPYDLYAYLDGEPVAKINAGTPDVTFTDLSPFTTYNVQIFDPNTGRIRFLQDFATVGVKAELLSQEMTETTLLLIYSVTSTTDEIPSLLFELLQNGTLIKQQSPEITPNDPSIRTVLFEALSPFTRYDIRLVYAEDTSLIDVTTCTTASYFDFPSPPFESVPDENGDDIVLVKHIDDTDYENYNTFDVYAPTDILPENLRVECISANGYTLPLTEEIFETSERYRRFSVMTQFACPDEIYFIRLYDSNDVLSGNLIETRRIRLSDVHNAAPYPQFSLSARQNVETDGSTEITLLHTGGDLLKDAQGNATYAVVVANEIGETVYVSDLIDFAATQIHTMLIYEALASGDYSVALMFPSPETGYTIFRQIITINNSSR